MRIEIHTPHLRAEDAGPPILLEAWKARASAVVLVLGSSSDPLASCAMWAGGLPCLEGKRLGCIGRFTCNDEAAARVAVQSAFTWLEQQGCELVVGPLDGNTWHRYRFVTESSSHPPFFMEPANPPEWPEFWQSAGFAPLATYHSSLNEELKSHDPLLDKAEARVREAGLSVRPIDLADFDRELRAIFDLSLSAFAENFLYAPIGWNEFKSMYDPMKGLIDPQLALLCDDPMRPGALAGYIMAFPDVLERQRVGTCRTVILKSMAVHASWRSFRLGTLLIAQAQANARALGMSRSIFALMHDANPSARISEQYARVIRRYALFGRELGS